MLEAIEIIKYKNIINREAVKLYLAWYPILSRLTVKTDHGNWLAGARTNLVGSTICERTMSIRLVLST